MFANLSSSDNNECFKCYVKVISNNNNNMSEIL